MCCPARRMPSATYSRRWLGKMVAEGGKEEKRARGGKGDGENVIELLCLVDWLSLPAFLKSAAENNRA